MIEAMKANADEARRRAEAYAEAIERPWQLRKRAFKRLVIAGVVSGAAIGAAVYGVVALLVKAWA